MVTWRASSEQLPRRRRVSGKGREQRAPIRASVTCGETCCRGGAPLKTYFRLIFLDQTGLSVPLHFGTGSPALLPSALHTKAHSEPFRIYTEITRVSILGMVRQLLALFVWFLLLSTQRRHCCVSLRYRAQPWSRSSL